jgi:hypothetical protein
MHVKSIERNLILPKAQQTIAPGKSRLVSPFFNVSDVQYNEYRDPERLSARTPARVPWIDGAVQSVEVDAVIHDDSSTAGRDMFHLRESYVAARHAEH